MLNKPEFLKRLDYQYGHLPWFRRYEFLIPTSIIIILIIFLLPPSGRPTLMSQWGIIILFYSLLFGWTMLILSDQEKPILLKRAASLALVGFFLFLFIQYSGGRWDKIQVNFFNPTTLSGLGPVLFEGLKTTLLLAGASAILSLAIGLIVGTLRSIHNPVLEPFLAAYVDFFRSLPLLTLLILAYYALPFIGIDFDPFPAAVFALAINSSAYIAEIIRGGIEAVHRTQFEASKALGLSDFQTLSYVILPQSIRIIIPPLTSSFILLLKDTSLAYAITLPELLTKANKAMEFRLNPTPLMAVSLIYLLLLMPLTRLTNKLEKDSKRWVKK